jgi:riboflavin biosynthesis pyrimidine reductase
VAAPDEERAVLCGSGAILADAQRFRMFAGRGATVVCSAAVAAGRGNGAARVLAVPANGSPALDPTAVSAALAGSGHGAIFVEGGGRTVSGFLAAGAIDVLHVTIAPKLLGPGIDAFALPEVASVEDGRRLHAECFPLGGDLLLECRPLA